MINTRPSSRWWDVELHPEQCSTVHHDTPDHYHNQQATVYAVPTATR